MQETTSCFLNKISHSFYTSVVTTPSHYSLAYLIKTVVCITMNIHHNFGTMNNNKNKNHLTYKEQNFVKEITIKLNEVIYRYRIS